VRLHQRVAHASACLAVVSRLSKRGLLYECEHVERANVALCTELYDTVGKSLHKWDRVGHAAYVALQLKLSTRVLEGAKQRPAAADPLVLFEDAANVRKPASELIKHVAQKCKLPFDRAPTGLKSLRRVLEKAALRAEHAGSAACVCDVVRDRLVVPSFQRLVQVMEELLERASVGEIQIVRIQDRFAVPLPGGWRDMLVNYVLLAPFEGGADVRHVCELQLVHAQMLPALRQFEAHAAASATRNAHELLAHVHMEVADKRDEGAARLLADGRYTATQLVDVFGAGAGVGVIRTVASSGPPGVRVLHRAYVSAADARAAGVDAREMLAGGYGPAQLVSAACGLDELLEAGLRGTELALARGVLSMHAGAVYAASALSPSRTLSASDDGVLCVSSLSTCEPIWAATPAHAGAVYAIHAFIAPDGTALALSGGDDGLICLWSVDEQPDNPSHLVARLAAHRGGAPTRIAPSHTHQAEPSTTHTTRATAGSLSLSLFSLSSLSHLTRSADQACARHAPFAAAADAHRARSLAHTCAAVNCVTTVGGGTRALSGSGDMSIIEWWLDGPSSAYVRTLGGVAPSASRGVAGLAGVRALRHVDSVYAVQAYCHDTRAASSSYDKTVLIWDLHKGVVLRELKEHGGAVYALHAFVSSSASRVRWLCLGEGGAGGVGGAGGAGVGVGGAAPVLVPKLTQVLDERIVLSRRQQRKHGTSTASTMTLLGELICIDAAEANSCELAHTLSARRVYMSTPSGAAAAAAVRRYAPAPSFARLLTASYDTTYRRKEPNPGLSRARAN
jgi:hypothetical protein